MIVVSDTSPIRCLHHLDMLWVLHKLFDRVLIPPAVAAELAEAAPPELPLPIKELGAIQVQAPRSQEHVRRLREQIDPGEAEAIALALETHCDLLLIDERRGRRVASEHGLSVTGVLGVLITAKRQGHLARLAPHLGRLRDERQFFLGDRMVSEILRGEGEEPV